MLDYKMINSESRSLSSAFSRSRQLITKHYGYNRQNTWSGTTVLIMWIKAVVIILQERMVLKKYDEIPPMPPPPHPTTSIFLSYRCGSISCPKAAFRTPYLLFRFLQHCGNSPKSCTEKGTFFLTFWRCFLDFNIFTQLSCVKGPPLSPSLTPTPNSSHKPPLLWTSEIFVSQKVQSTSL